MGLSSLVLLLIALVALVHGTGPSPIPVCEFKCPSPDLQGRPLLEHSNSASQLFCRYQTIPNDFFCKYFLDDGILKQDHDEGRCPPAADLSCISKKKRNALPRAPAPPSPAARSPKPQVMMTRGKLGKKKRGK